MARLHNLEPTLFKLTKETNKMFDLRIFFFFAPSSLIILVNISLCYTIYCIFFLYFFHCRTDGG